MQTTKIVMCTVLPVVFFYQTANIVTTLKGWRNICFDSFTKKTVFKKHDNPLGLACFLIYN